jgi:hypothetical protein
VKYTFSNRNRVSDISIEFGFLCLFLLFDVVLEGTMVVYCRSLRRGVDLAARLPH